LGDGVLLGASLDVDDEDDEEAPSPVLDFASDDDFSPDSLLRAFFLDSDG